MKKLYFNQNNIKPSNSLKRAWRWQKNRLTTKKDLSYVVPQAEKKEIKFLNQNRTDFSLTWIGHSTFLIQLNGLNILTDPVWSKKMGFGKRLSEPGLTFEQLPEIDIVLISHNHYDHLSFWSIKQLKGKPMFILPEGLGTLFKKKGLQPYMELPWWESTKIKETTITMVPAQHWSKRSLYDTNQSHWGGYILSFEKEVVYFAGDSGYFPGFKEIGEKFSINYALLPIGAYEPEFFMHIQHTTPEEAIQAFLDLNAKTFIPMHYGAFRLADDTPKEGLDRFNNEWKRLQLPEEKRIVLTLGETHKKDV